MCATARESFVTKILLQLAMEVETTRVSWFVIFIISIIFVTFAVIFVLFKITIIEITKTQ